MTIYSAGRDVMRARNADWHETYTLPTLNQFFVPSREDHGSYWYDWTTWDEVAWRKYMQVWMSFLNDYKNRGGKVTVGSDSGFIYQTYGFGTILELELLQEAGFHPLEVIRAATMHGAMELNKVSGEPIERGVIREGFLADIVLLEENPLAQPQGALRHRRRSTQRRDPDARASRRRALHDQGRHRLRRQAAAGRRRGDGRGAEGGSGRRARRVTQSRVLREAPPQPSPRLGSCLPEATPPQWRRIGG